MPSRRTQVPNDGNTPSSRLERVNYANYSVVGPRRLNKRMPLLMCMFFLLMVMDHGSIFLFIYIYIYTHHFFCLYFLLYLYTPCGSFFLIFYQLHIPFRGDGYYTTRYFFFFCLRMNPTHKFRGIFFNSFFSGRKKLPRPLDVTDFFSVFFLFLISF